jgi:hypothetical protein
MWNLLVGPLADLASNILKRVLPEKMSEEEKAKIELQFRLALLQADAEKDDAAAKLIESVNATMREEAKSEHWPQWSWRPTIGFTFAAVIINNYIALPYFAKFGVVALPIPDRVWEALLVILGAAAFTRGWQKTEEAKAGN